MAHKIAKFRQMPLQAQHEVFKTLMSKVAHTEFGKVYGLTEETTYEEFRSKVPIHDYEKLRPYVEKIRAGEKDILWPGIPLYLATTSEQQTL